MARQKNPERDRVALPDEEQRRAIREDLDTTILVEAAAGTGKTRSLVERMVGLIATGRATVERLCSVTFTLRAAAQLKQKFQSALEQRLRQETDPRCRERLSAGLSGIDFCFVGTIHAFCARLLRERPVEAGIEPGFVEMDEPENGIARGQAWNRFVESLFVTGDPRLSRLIDLGVRLDDLSESFGTICDNSDVDPVVGSQLPEPDFTHERARVEAFLERAAAAIPPDPPAGGWSRFPEAVRRARRLSALLDPARAADFVEVLRVLSPGAVRDDAGSFKKDFERLREEIVKPALHRWGEFLYPQLLALLLEAREEFALARRRNGRANFQDLLLEARDLLKAHPSVRSALFERFTPILVDEFQDTDPIQAEILFYLTGTDRQEREWTRLVPSPGSLFLVGDPKQSIYRFRRADIQTYKIVESAVEKCGRVLRLTTNFRSNATLCDWVNGVFGRPTFFAPERTSEQAAYVPLSPELLSAVSGPAVFRLETTAFGNADQPVVDADAARIADAIAAAVARKERRPEDFLILFRRRKFMADYARALEARGLLVDLGGGGAFGDSEEIASLMPLLQALADPDNPVPLVAGLRGPIFGIDDEALYRFSRLGGRFDFRAEVPEAADPRILRAYELLRLGEELVSKLPPAAAMARFAGRLGWIALAASQPLGGSRTGNLLKALAAARRFSSEGLDFPAVVDALEALRREELIEQMSAEPGRAGAVRLLTIHGAKGLEASVVFLAEPAREHPKLPKCFIDRTATPPAAYFRVVRSTRDFSEEEIARPPDWEEMQQIEKRFEDAEKIRLLYVAATRAKEMLVVSIKRNKNGRAAGAWEKLDRYLTSRLPEPARRAAVPAPAPLDSTSVELEAFRGRRAQIRERGRIPSYGVATVTALAHAGQARPAWQEAGRGMEWGRILHRLLEAVMREPSTDVRGYARNLFAEEERPSEDLDQVIQLVERVRGSSLWRRALTSPRRLVEVPFALTVPTADLGLAGPLAETLLQGAIDLVFEEEDGWVVVDYKSDIVSGNITSLVDFYRPQVAHYRRYWEQLVGRKTTAALYFIETGQEWWMT